MGQRPCRPRWSPGFVRIPRLGPFGRPLDLLELGVEEPDGRLHGSLRPWQRTRRPGFRTSWPLPPARRPNVEAHRQVNLSGFEPLAPDRHADVGLLLKVGEHSFDRLTDYGADGLLDRHPSRGDRTQPGGIGM